MHPFTLHEKDVLRGLAERYAAIASSERQREVRRRMRQFNDREAVRPVVLMDEIPWHELGAGGELTNRCENPLAKEMETFFLRALFQHKYFPCDHYCDNHYAFGKTVHIDGVLETAEDTLKLDDANHISSHDYHDQLQSEADLEKEVTAAKETGKQCAVCGKPLQPKSNRASIVRIVRRRSGSDGTLNG